HAVCHASTMPRFQNKSPEPWMTVRSRPSPLAAIAVPSVLPSSVRKTLSSSLGAKVAAAISALRQPMVVSRLLWHVVIVAKGASSRPTFLAEPSLTVYVNPVPALPWDYVAPLASYIISCQSQLRGSWCVNGLVAGCCNPLPP